MPKDPKSPSSSRAQPTISAYFSPSPTRSQRPLKRTSSPIIDLTSEGEGQPVAKKSKTSNLSRSSYSEPGPSQNAAADKWRFFPATQQEPKSPSRLTAAEDIGRKQRHEAFKKKLLGENNPFLRRLKSEDVNEDDDGGDETGDKSKVVEDIQERNLISDDSDSGLKDLLAHFELPSKAKGKRKVKVKEAAVKQKELGPMGEPVTEMERQVVELKKEHPNTVLMIEVGYKYVFFGDDAKIASKELGIVCYPKGNFLRASIPTVRREIHLKKLLAQGYKVGVVDQTETAALKQASQTRNKLFGRGLSELYTATTYVDELDSVDDLERSSAPPLMCLIEERMGGMGVDERVSFGTVVVCPSTGDVVWDDFEDTHMRIELETRMSHTRPSEMLMPVIKLSVPTEKMLDHFVSTATEDHRIRVERFKDIMTYTEAFSFVSSFYTDNARAAGASHGLKSGELLATATDFPKRVIIALAHTIKYLSEFHIANAFLRTEFFSKFATRMHMLLQGNTLTNLEIYRNETDYTRKGSLIWVLDHTHTRFGARMLHNWVGRPLIDMRLLQERFDAVEEITQNQSGRLVMLREVLKGLPDLAKGLCRIQYNKCSPKELSILLRAFNKIALSFSPMESHPTAEFKSSILNDIINTLPKLREPIQGLLKDVSLAKTQAGDMEGMWTDPDKFPMITEYGFAIQAVEGELTEDLKSIRKVLKKPSLSWTTVAGEEVKNEMLVLSELSSDAKQYLIEVRKDENRHIPEMWQLISSTKYFRRYRTPEVKRKMQQRAQYIEARQEAARTAYQSFISEIAENYYGVLRDAVNKLAVADCLLSLALIAVQEGYVRPQFTDDDTLEIVEGRHPMVEVLRSDPFVPNTIRMGRSEPRSKIITGPNMGGKSSCVRMVALISIMAQIGSYVPAESVRMGMLDGIMTRMGASDELARGRSTFMVEMSETSDILHTASPKSLVIADELGRGTATFDGMAIAYGVLQHLVETIKCKTLFITHYPLVAIDLERQFPLDVQNLHMGFSGESRIDGSVDITFLYRLSAGLAEASFGIECARLANLSDKILQVAHEHSERMRYEVEERNKQNKARKCARLIKQVVSGQDTAQSLRGLYTLLDNKFVPTKSGYSI